MLREENKIITDWFSVKGFVALGTRIRRRVAKSFEMPALTAKTVESNIEAGTNQLPIYNRLELAELPTPVKVTWEEDKIWGLVKCFSYLQDGNTELPAVASEYPATTGRKILRVESSTMIGEVVAIKIVTVPSDSVTIVEKKSNTEFNVGYDETKVYKLAASSPAIETDGTVQSDGTVTEVTRESFNLWLKLTRPVNPFVGYSARRSWREHEVMVWPAVLTNFGIEELLEYDTFGNSRDITYATYSLQDSYAEPVECELEEWWTTTAPTVGSGDLTGASDPMQPSAVAIVGVTEPVQIPPCLHGAISYSKKVFEAFVGHKIFNVEIDATPNHTTWPETFVEFKIKPDQGGYRVRKLTWNRPFLPSSTITSSVDDPP